ncbi:hypothetical protein EV192_106351 [Actinocrispum wychmicini]|uniref:Uncharacterized protein n=1 Tax=Actinocrispum wychmicini TaxID=1213861 RepID=A0A4R2JIN9_9PSEU|nr:hypothetical protein EV192_106351 [Actinocrispum wychmicini]
MIFQWLPIVGLGGLVLFVAVQCVVAWRQAVHTARRAASVAALHIAARQYVASAHEGGDRNG